MSAVKIRRNRNSELEQLQVRGTRSVRERGFGDDGMTGGYDQKRLHTCHKLRFSAFSLFSFLLQCFE